MESANSHHHQQQQHHQLLADSSCHGLSWYQNSALHGARNNANTSDVEQHINRNIDLGSPSLAQDLGLPWSRSSSMEGFMAHEQLQHLSRIKHELSVSGSYPGLSEMISSSPTSSIEDLHMSKNSHDQQIRYHNNNQDMFLKTFSNGCQIKGDHITFSEESSLSYRGSFSQILPTLSIASLNQSSSSLDINLPAALDPFGCPTFDHGSFSYQPCSLNVDNLFKDNCLSYGLDQMHHLNHKVSPALMMEAKRAANEKAPKGTPPKKSKLELRPSCAPLKVRKEKLGDRISSLQQMVAPFGKTDTASVLMEAIGYIKFLQNQVETLSVPYMNSTQKASRIPTRVDGNDQEMMQRDLRSRGLCLVPLSCLSYVTYGGGSIWPNP